MAWRLLLGPLTQTRTITVVLIGDGVTLRVHKRSRTLNLRLACIDASEPNQDPFGVQARPKLQALAPVESTMELRFGAVDPYGRSVAALSRGGRTLNQALVASSEAFVYWQEIAGSDRQI